MCSTRSCHRTGLFWYSRRKTSRPGADLSPTIADDVAGRVAVGPHPRTSSPLSASFPRSVPSFRRPDSSFPRGQTTYPSVPTMITPVRAICKGVRTMIPAVPTMIQGVPTMIQAAPTIIPVVPTMIPSVPTMIRAVRTLIPPMPTMIPAVPISSARSRASSTGRRSKPAPVPTMVREASGKRARGLYRLTTLASVGSKCYNTFYTVSGLTEGKLHAAL
jgi:hypothetical protein